MKKALDLSNCSYFCLQLISPAFIRIQMALDRELCVHFIHIRAS